MVARPPGEVSRTNGSIESGLLEPRLLNTFNTFAPSTTRSRKPKPWPHLFSARPKISLRQGRDCAANRRQIPFTVAQISQPSAVRRAKVSLPVDDDSNWSNGEPGGPSYEEVLTWKRG